MKEFINTVFFAIAFPFLLGGLTAFLWRLFKFGWEMVSVFWDYLLKK